ncbi:MAG: sulfotransferase domain-containing protein [Gammaproteobacteria bacterium]|nr:sulfotransferase domain-containing protein [Gammaproteobacteria bacterium]
MNLPNLIIIGAMKAATTSLHYYLNLHPDVSMSKEKELNFFTEGNWDLGVEWYASQFNSGARIRGETSPAYTRYPLERDVPRRMNSVVPEAKLIYLLRDPIERLISQYVHRIADGRETRPFEDALAELRDNPYIVLSQYFMQLQQFLRFYETTSILIVTQEDLRNNPRDTMSSIFRFLEVDDAFYSEHFKTIRHKSAWKKRRKNGIGLYLAQTSLMKNIEKLPFSIRSNVAWFLYLPFSKRVSRPHVSTLLKQRIIDYLQDDIDRLRRFTTYKFEDWCL